MRFLCFSIFRSFFTSEKSARYGYLSVLCLLLSLQPVFSQTELSVGSNDGPLKLFHQANPSQEVEPSLVLRTSFVPPANDNCLQAQSLSVNGACVSGTTDQATLQAGESATPGCVTSAFTQTVWYSFIATSTTMFVQMNVTGYGGTGATWGPANWAAAVYRSTGACPPSPGSLVSCRNTNSVGTSDGVITNYLTGLTIGATYLVQVGYSTGMGANSVPIFCIRVGDQFLNCNTCNSPCGPACGFSSSPTVTQVTTSCPPYPQFPLLEGTVADTQCYTFTAVNTTVSFNVILNSTCGTGNVTNFTWNLYTSNCGAPIQSGTLSNLTFTGLTVGQRYTYCYSFAVPSGCYHSIYYPYFVGAAPVVLPVELIRFEAEKISNGVMLKWTTATETGNERFDVLRSKDGQEFSRVGAVPGNGTTTSLSDYEFLDTSSPSGTVYYKLTQVDLDGNTESFGPVAVRTSGGTRIDIFPNPSNSIPNFLIDAEGADVVEWSVCDMLGNSLATQSVLISKGENRLPVDHFKLNAGSYFFKARIGDQFFSRRFSVIR